MTPRDIGDPFIQIIQYLLQLVNFCFSLLDSITFLGTSLLDFTIGITIISAVIPIIFSIAKSRSGGSSRKPSSSDSED